MIVWRSVPAWTLRAWPVLAIAPCIGAHALAIHLFPQNVPIVHKTVGLLLQMSGGLLILFSINKNLGLFRQQSLSDAFLAWLCDFPFRRGHVILTGTGAATGIGSATAVSVGRRKPVTLEERVAELELQIAEVRSELSSQIQALNTKIESARSELASQVLQTEGKVSMLTTQLEEASVGGFKVQAFGVLLALYGAVTSVLA